MGPAWVWGDREGELSGYRFGKADVERVCLVWMLPMETFNFQIYLEGWMDRISLCVTRKAAEGPPQYSV